jgi:hypothetical protein
MIICSAGVQKICEACTFPLEYPTYLLYLVHALSRKNHPTQTQYEMHCQSDLVTSLHVSQPPAPIVSIGLSQEAHPRKLLTVYLFGGMSDECREYFLFLWIHS